MSPLHGRGWHEGIYVSRMGNSKRRDWGAGGRTEDRAPSDQATGAGRAQRHSAVLSGLNQGGGGTFHVVTALGTKRLTVTPTQEPEGNKQLVETGCPCAHLALQVSGHIGTDGPGG